MKTRLTDILEIEHPVMLAGMGGVSYSTLVAAVSEAGGFGCLGASTMSPEVMVEEIRAVKKATDKPFGVDLLTAAARDMAKQVQMLIDEGSRVFVAGLGVPRDVIDLCHKHNVLVVNMCGKVRHAIAAVEAGCDIVVAQGTEAGGHTGQVATFPLVPQIVDAVGDRVPVVAAGGIFDGRGLAAALSLGADGVWVGTRFIATPEARAVPGYKDTLVRLHEDETVISRAYTGKTCRVVRTPYTQHFEEHPEELQPFPMQAGRAMQDGVFHLGGDENTEVDISREFMPAGQGVGAIDELVPAAELVRRFVDEAEQALAKLNSYARV
ncbi:MAG TPA: nitronate monooxygenase [Acidimicrobiales bacterium]|jgi:enoyl-[acyl-carrier protein] reductase II|nr:nitronate monooxygenase [Acidimicrobiales bacterium]